MYCYNYYHNITTKKSISIWQDNQLACIVVDVGGGNSSSTPGSCVSVTLLYESH